MLIIHIRYALSIKHLIHINMSVAATPLTRPSNSHIGPHSQKGMNNQRKRMKGTKKTKAVHYHLPKDQDHSNSSFNYPCVTSSDNFALAKICHFDR